MYCYIGTNETRVFLDGVGQEKFVSEKIGHFDSDAFIKLCQQMANLSVDVLFLDMRCADDEAIVKGVRMLRFHRSNTRIVCIAPNREPGDSTISYLVSLGVYDIVAFDEETDTADSVCEMIENILLRPPNYADAARWHFQLEVPTVQTKTEKEKVKRVPPPAPPMLDDFEIELPLTTKPKIIERILGTATIAVGGVTRRTGSTQLAISLATYLSRKNYETACVELSEYPVFHYIHEEAPARLEKGFRRGSDFYPTVDDRLLNAIFSQRYQFVVMDLGDVVNESRYHIVQSELARASVVFLTMGPSEWDFNHMIRTLDSLHAKGFAHQWNVIVNFADPETFREIEQVFTSSERERLRVQFFRNPIQANPFQVHADQEAIYEECLATVIPKREKRRFRLF